jgi:hypothetical protein
MDDADDFAASSGGAYLSHLDDTGFCWLRCSTCDDLLIQATPGITLTALRTARTGHRCHARRPAQMDPTQYLPMPGHGEVRAYFNASPAWTFAEPVGRLELWVHADGTEVVLPGAEHTGCRDYPALIGAAHRYAVAGVLGIDPETGGAEAVARLAAVEQHHRPLDGTPELCSCGEPNPCPTRTAVFTPIYVRP